MSWEKEADAIRARRAAAKAQGGAKAVAAQHAKGRLTIRERIERFSDTGSFREVGPIAGAAEEEGFAPANYILGHARAEGRAVVVGGEDFTLKGGSPNAAGLRKSVYAEDLALREQVPLVRLLEGGGGSVRGAGGRREGPPVFDAPRFLSIARCLEEVPVASAALGPVAGFPAARLAASHFAVMTRESAQVMVAGPRVVERALGGNHTKESLGAASVHAKTGVVDAVATDEDDALGLMRRFLDYMPDNAWADLRMTPCDDPLDRAEASLIEMVPRDRRRVYDMRKILDAVADAGSFFELTRGWGGGLITGLARLGGLPVGVFANDCRHYAGALTAEGSQKLVRFVDLCNNFRLPVVTFVDEPGFMIGPDAEAAGTIRYGTAAVTAVMQSRVPWATVIVRKTFGVAAMVHFAPDAYVLAWPSAERGALPLEGGVAVAFAREIAAAPDPDARRAELEAELAALQSPFPSAENFSVHDLIDPRETRAALTDWSGRLGPRLKRLAGPHRVGLRR